ncbi:MAG TPA: hypothetical protein VGC34_14515, partial [Steroidobacteraceae bacterium]
MKLAIQIVLALIAGTAAVDSCRAAETNVPANSNGGSPPATATIGPKGCATALSADEVKGYVSSDSTNDAKAQSLVLLLRANVVGGWNVIGRQKDVAVAANAGAAAFVQQKTDPAAIATGLTASLNAVCTLPVSSDAQDIQTAAAKAAGVTLPSTGSTAAKSDADTSQTPDLSGSGQPDPVVGDVIGLDVVVPDFRKVDSTGKPLPGYYFALACSAMKIDNKDTANSRYYVHFLAYTRSFSGRGKCQTWNPFGGSDALDSAKSVVSTAKMQSGKSGVSTADAAAPTAQPGAGQQPAPAPVDTGPPSTP